jgi:methyl-accepting chemotaxis protein
MTCLIAMTWTTHRTLLVALSVATAMFAAGPREVMAQPAPRLATDVSGDPTTQQDRDALAVANQLAVEASQLIEQWITTQVITEDRLFARLYFPIPKTRPRKYGTPYDALAERDLVGPEDKALARAATLQYAIITDVNGYIPAHNTRFTQPLSGNPAEDYVNNRTKRMLGDTVSLIAARSEARYLIQRARVETGDVIYDLSVPITVRGKHWGCVRIGYRRNE